MFIDKSRSSRTIAATALVTRVPSGACLDTVRGVIATSRTRAHSMMMVVKLVISSNRTWFTKLSAWWARLV